MKTRLPLLACASLAAVAIAGPAQADEAVFAGSSASPPWTLTLNGGTVITAFDMGWVGHDGAHGNGLFGTGNQNYLAGEIGGSDFYNNYGSFHLGGFSSPVTSAVLTLDTAAVILSNPATWTLYSVLASAAALDMQRFAGDAVGVSLHNDLGSGTIFGSFGFLPTTPNDTFISITLNANGLAALNAAGGAEFVIGGSLNQHNNPIPEPASWAMMIGGFGLVGAAMRRRQRVAVTYA